jgi:hypothetical protein
MYRLVPFFISASFISSALIRRFMVLTAVCLASGTPAQSATYDIPQDTAAAINRPDEYAWKLFVALNWPADVTKRAASPTAKFGADGPVVWETWKNARGEVFRSDGKDPGDWLDQPAVVASRNAADVDPRPLQQIARDNQLGIFQPAFDPLAAINQINETRLNKEAYEFVRSKTLYNRDGQNELAKAGELTISFPLSAKEIKAQWRVISEADKPRYHWTTLRQGNTTIIFGLTALHITTKDLPNWFWATFEHVDNPTRPGNESWMLESRDSFACPTAPYNCNLAPSGIGLQGTKWAFFRLRGTQTDFVDSRGNITLLANSQPEGGFQKSSSCITCHARATIGASGNDRLQVFMPNGESANGPPDPNWFVTKDANGKSILHYTQLDFVWSLFRAQPKQ